jgi:hypothetical protein
MLDQLIGTWRTDRSDQLSLKMYGEVSLDFDGHGKLKYTIHLPTKEQVMLLTYRVDGPWLVTDQPSTPREHRARFSFTDDGRLAVENGESQPTFYVRE